MVPKTHSFRERRLLAMSLETLSLFFLDQVFFRTFALYYEYHDSAKNTHFEREGFFWQNTFTFLSKKKFLRQAFLWQTSRRLYLLPVSQNPLESSHSTPEKTTCYKECDISVISIQRPVLGRPVSPFGWVASHQHQSPP